MKRKPFTVIVPAIYPGDKPTKHDLMVEVDNSEGVEVLTANSMRVIESVQTGTMINKLRRGLCELFRRVEELEKK